MYICIFSVIVSIVLAIKAEKKNRNDFFAMKAVAYTGVIVLSLIHVFRNVTNSDNCLTAAILMASVFETVTNWLSFREKVRNNKSSNQDKKSIWINSTARKISIILFVVSLAFIFVALSPLEMLNGELAEGIRSILIGSATSLFGIIVTISFVQYFIDKRHREENEYKEKIDEIKKIKQYNNMLALLIERYKMYFKCVTTPLENRNADTELDISGPFEFTDLRDMYSTSLYIVDNFKEPAIKLFYDAEENLRQYFIKIIENVEFKYNTDLLKIIQGFIDVSLKNDVRGAVLGNLETGNDLIGMVRAYIVEDNNYNWVEKDYLAEGQSNIMIPYVILYEMLQEEAKLMERYEECIESLNKNENV